MSHEGWVRKNRSWSEERENNKHGEFEREAVGGGGFAGLRQ